MKATTVIQEKLQSQSHFNTYDVAHCIQKTTSPICDSELRMVNKTARLTHKIPPLLTNPILNRFDRSRFRIDLSFSYTSELLNAYPILI
jgi:hypothetical protein